MPLIGKHILLSETLKCEQVCILVSIETQRCHLLLTSQQYLDKNNNNKIVESFSSLLSKLKIGNSVSSAL